MNLAFFKEIITEIACSNKWKVRLHAKAAYPMQLFEQYEIGIYVYHREHLQGINVLVRDRKIFKNIEQYTICWADPFCFKTLEEIFSKPYIREWT